MLENNNGKVISKLALCSLKGNKMRNFFIVFTVVLSVSLLTVMSLFCSALIESDKKAVAKVQHVIYQQVNKGQFESLKKDKRVEYATPFKLGQSFEMGGHMIRPVYYDRNSSKIETIKVSYGKLPEKENEIVLDKSYMGKLGRKANIGETIYFTFLDGTTEKFVVSGYTDSGIKSGVYAVLFSKEYAERGTQFKNIPYGALVRINGADKMSKDQFIKVIHSVGQDYGIERKYIIENRLFSYMLSMNFQQIMVIIGIGVGILLASVLVIYSIFYISVVSRIRQFGQFRTLGMTERQIRKMVNKEGLALCAIGIPIGLVIGGIIAYFLKPEGWNWINSVFVGAVVAAADIITLLFSIHKPAKLASTVSPLEASKFSFYSGSKKETSKLHRRITPISLAFMNSIRNGKKTFLTMLSLGIGGVLFLMAATFIVSINKEEYSRQTEFYFGEYLIEFSYNAVETSEHGYSDIQINNPLNKKLKEKIKAVPGVKGIKSIEQVNIQYEYNNEKEKDFLTPFTRDKISLLKKSLSEGNFDYDKMIKNNEILVIANDNVKEFYGWKFKAGDKVKIHYYNGKPMEKEFKIAACMDDYVSYKNLGGPWGYFLIPDEALKSLMNNMDLTTGFIVSAVDFSKNGKSIEKNLNKIVGENSLLSMDTLRERMEQDENNFSIMYGVILGLAAFIICFSFINLINTLIMNILTRRQELAMMESIGMSSRQLDVMLQGEGIILAVGNIFITLLLGTSLGYLLIQAMRDIGTEYVHYHFPGWYLLGYTLIILLLPMIISGVQIHSFKKDSLVDRLRERE